jgi:putative flippase GtrA
MSSLISKAGYVSRYLGSGALNTIIGFAVIFLLMSLGISPVISNVAGYAVGLLLGFMVSRSFVFRSDGHVLSEGARYLICFGVSFAMNLLVLTYALETLQLSKELSQIVAAGTYTVLMFVFSYYLVFVSRP